MDWKSAWINLTTSDQKKVSKDDTKKMEDFDKMKIEQERARKLFYPDASVAEQAKKKEGGS